MSASKLKVRYKVTHFKPSGKFYTEAVTDVEVPPRDSLMWRDELVAKIGSAGLSGGRGEFFTLIAPESEADADLAMNGHLPCVPFLLMADPVPPPDDAIVLREDEETVERLAEALYGLSPYWVGKSAPEPWGDVPPQTKEAHRKDARHVLAVLRIEAAKR